jgi:transcriptional regulator with XRE-family HTH domain
MEKVNEEDYLKALGRRIIELREAAGMSRDDLAKVIGTTRMQIYRIETGIKKNSPTILILLRLANHFKIHLSELIQ